MTIRIVVGSRRVTLVNTGRSDAPLEISLYYGPAFYIGVTFLCAIWDGALHLLLNPYAVLGYCIGTALHYLILRVYEYNRNHEHTDPATSNSEDKFLILLTKMLDLLLTPDAAESVIADLHEGFLLRSATIGRLHAIYWCTSQAIRIIYYTAINQAITSIRKALRLSK